jgi:deazaflavin-dependent oxidoreductase (nitroreductase family)
MAPRPEPSLLGRLALAGSKAANKRGLYLGRRATKVHVALYRRSGGRLGGHLPGMPAARILLLDHVGAKSGRRRTSPLIFHEEDGALAVVASKGGQPTDPAWYHNLKANPETTIQVGAEVRRVRAREATAAEREELWPQLTAVYPDYDFLASLAAPRRVPVVILAPAPQPRRSAAISRNAST